MKDLLIFMFLPIIVLYYDKLLRKTYRAEMIATNINEKYYMYIAKYNINMLSYIRNQLPIEVEKLLYDESIGDNNLTAMIRTHINHPNEFLVDKLLSCNDINSYSNIDYFVIAIEKYVSFSEKDQLRLIHANKDIHKIIRNLTDDAAALQSMVHEL